jgi:protocatechuate 3,4-dioxygenase beta subunit
VVRVSIEVRNKAARFRVGIQATSIQGAISLVTAYYFAGDVRVIFPIDPECFSVEDAIAKEGLIERGKPQEEEKLAA